MSEAPNRLITIGPIGCQYAYLNVPRDEAIRRYMAAQVCFPGDRPEPPRDDQIREFTFYDSFHVYAAGPLDEDGPATPTADTPKGGWVR